MSIIKFVERIFDILILSEDIKPQKSSCVPNIARCLPGGKTSQNIIASPSCMLYACYEPPVRLLAGRLVIGLMVSLSVGNK